MAPVLFHIAVLDFRRFCQEGDDEFGADAVVLIEQMN